MVDALGAEPAAACLGVQEEIHELGDPSVVGTNGGDLRAQLAHDRTPLAS
jgi:hypothetical protein